MRSVRGLALLLAVALAAGGCATLPTVRTFDPFAASEQEVDIALAQVEDVLRMQHYRVRNERMWTGGITLVVGIALEAFLLGGAGDDTCFNDPTPENDCVAEVALAVAAAGGAVGSGLTTMILPSEGELDLEGYFLAQPANLEQRRVKLEYGYQLLERSSVEGGSVIHQVGSGLLLGAGVALITVPTLLPDDTETDAYSVAGAVGIGLGVFWAIAATVFREPRVYDLELAPRVTTDAGMLVLGGRF